MLDLMLYISNCTSIAVCNTDLQSVHHIQGHIYIRARPTYFLGQVDTYAVAGCPHLRVV